MEDKTRVTIRTAPSARHLCAAVTSWNGSPEPCNSTAAAVAANDKEGAYVCSFHIDAAIAKLVQHRRIQQDPQWGLHSNLTSRHLCPIKAGHYDKFGMRVPRDLVGDVVVACVGPPCDDDDAMVLRAVDDSARDARSGEVGRRVVHVRLRLPPSFGPTRSGIDAERVSGDRSLRQRLRRCWRFAVVHLRLGPERNHEKPVILSHRPSSAVPCTPRAQRTAALLLAIPGVPPNQDGRRSAVNADSMDERDAMIHYGVVLTSMVVAIVAAVGGILRRIPWRVNRILLPASVVAFVVALAPNPQDR